MFTPVLAKQTTHTKHLSLVDILAVGEDRTQRNFEPMRKQVEAWNLPEQPLHVLRFYHNRTAVELIIKQLKGDCALGHIPTHHYPINETYPHLLLLAYNLIDWFPWLCLPHEFQSATLQTLRHRILLLPTQLSWTQDRPTLAFSASGQRGLAWKFALNKIDRLKP